MYLALDTSFGVYISQLIRFARASSHVTDFNTRNKLLTQKLLKQGYWYHNFRKTFSKFYRRYYDVISKFQVGLKSLLRQGLLYLNSMVTGCISCWLLALQWNILLTVPRRCFFCGSFVFFLSCVCYAFGRVCLYVPCSHLLGKGCHLVSRLWCLTVSLSLSLWYPGSGVVLECIDFWSVHPYLLL